MKIDQHGFYWVKAEHCLPPKHTDRLYSVTVRGITKGREPMELYCYFQYEKGCWEKIVSKGDDGYTTKKVEIDIWRTGQKS